MTWAEEMAARREAGALVEPVDDAPPVEATEQYVEVLIEALVDAGVEVPPPSPE